MKSEINRKHYLTPQIQLIKLDSKISLTLLSTPPSGPGEGGVAGFAPEYLKSDPFKLNQA